MGGAAGWTFAVFGATIGSMARSQQKADWVEVALTIVGSVERGEVTTYGDLSELFYGHRGGAQSVGSMLKKWVEDEPDTNYTHRVVKDDGTVADVGLHFEKLQKDGVPFDGATGRVAIDRYRATLRKYAAAA